MSNFIPPSWFKPAALVLAPNSLATEPTAPTSDLSDPSGPSSAFTTLAIIASSVAIGALASMWYNLRHVPHQRDLRATQPVIPAGAIASEPRTSSRERALTIHEPVEQAVLSGPPQVASSEPYDEYQGISEVGKRLLRSGELPRRSPSLFLGRKDGNLQVDSTTPAAMPIEARRQTGAAGASIRIAPQPKGYLSEALDAGCDAAESLATVTYALADRCKELLTRLLEGGVVNTTPIPKSKMKRREFLAMLSSNPLYARILPEYRVSSYIQFVSFFNSTTEPERYIKRLYTEFSLLLEGSKAALDSIKSKVAACEKGGKGGGDRRSIQLSLINEHFEEIQNLRNLLLRYIQEIAPALAEAAVSMGLMDDVTFFNEDPAADWGVVAREGFRVALERYREAHPDLPKKMLQVIAYRNDEVSFIKGLYEKLMSANQDMDRTHLPAFTRLVELIEKGTISKLGEIRMPAVVALGSASVGTIEKAPDIDPFSTDECLLPEGTGIVSGKAVAADVGPPSLIDFSTQLQRIVPVDAFTVPSAQGAYLGALDYVKCLHLLLTEPQGASMHPHEVAQYQMDIGYAGYHALEQLLTAIMLEKGKAGRGGEVGGKAQASGIEDNRAYFAEVGHSLISRLLASKISPPETVVSVLREVDGMEFAIRDLTKGWKTHPLLKNTSALLSSEMASGTVSLDIKEERRKATVFGPKVLKVVVSLLSLHSSKIKGHQVDLAHYFQASGDLIPEAAETSGARAKSVAVSPLSGKGKKTPTYPIKKAMEASPEFLQIENLSLIIAKALDESNDYENALLRKSTIEHNLNRYRYLLSCLSNPSKLPLFPFYANQARFVLRTIVEEFLCAAHESSPHKKSGGIVDQKLLAHKLWDLAAQLSLPLDSDQKSFLQSVPSIRNEARYDGHKVKASAAARGSFTASEELEDLPAAAGRGTEDSFRMALSRRNEGIKRDLLQDLTIVLGLCEKISNRLFPRKLR